MILKSPGRWATLLVAVKNTHTATTIAQTMRSFIRVLPDMAKEDWSSADQGRRIQFKARTGNRPPVIWASDAAAGFAARTIVRT